MQYAPHTTTAVTVTHPVVSVEEMMCVTMWLVTVLMDVNHTGRDLDVTVDITQIQFNNILVGNTIVRGNKNLFLSKSPRRVLIARSCCSICINTTKIHHNFDSYLTMLTKHFYYISVIIWPSVNWNVLAHWFWTEKTK